MKNTILIIALTFIFINCKAQTIVNANTFNDGNNNGKYFKDLDNHFQKFTGTWENTTGNITFRLILWKAAKVQMGTSPDNYYNDLIYGRFAIIQNAGTNNEIFLHDSVKYYPQNNITSFNVIIGNTYDGIYFSSYLEDNCANGGNDTIRAAGTLTITNSGSTPSIANWKIKPGGLLEGEYYSMPTQCVMTKVN